MDSIKKIKLRGAWVYIPIAILYNAFFHKLAVSMNSRTDWETNKKNSIKLILIVGILTLVVNKLINDESIKVDLNSDVIKGFKIGGILLLISAFLNSWDDMGEHLKLIMIGAALGTIVYMSRN